MLSTGDSFVLEMCLKFNHEICFIKSCLKTKKKQTTVPEMNLHLN